MAQHKAQGGFIFDQNAALAHMLRAVHPTQHPTAHRGDERQRRQQARAEGIGDRERHIHEEPAGQSLDKDDREKDADRRQGGRDDRARHLPCAAERRLDGRKPFAAQAVDVLDHDDRVIHQHADANGESRQREHVEADAAEIHQHDRKNHADGDGHRDDHRRLDVAQKQQQDDDRQRRAHQEVLQDAVDDQADVVALAVDHGEMQPVVFLFERRRGFADAVADRGGRDVALLGEAEDDAVAAVDLGVDLVGIIGDEHIGDVAKTDHADAVDFGVEQRQSGQLLFIGDLVAHAHQIAGVVLVGDIARGHGEILRREDARDRLDGHERIGICLFLRLLLLIAQLAEVLFKLALRRSQLCGGSRDLALLGGQLRQRAAHLEVRARLLLRDRGERLVDRDRVVVKPFEGGVQLLHAAVDLTDAVADGFKRLVEHARIGAKLRKLFVDLLDRAVHAL